MGLLQFNVSVGEKTRPIHMQASAGVDELFRKVSADCANGVNPDDIRLVFGDVHLEYNKNKRFKDYSLVHMSTITLLVRLHGRGNSNATQQEPTSLSTGAQGTINPTHRIVQLKEIPTWTEFYDSDREELIKCLQSIGETWKQEIESEYTVDPEINSKVSLFPGDITSLHVDGIVSSNNSNLTATGGVSLRITDVAGQGLENAMKKLNGCHTGEAKTTEGFNLLAKYVVHTVGPQEVEPKLLESCYRNCLEEMKTLQLKSLAFPCIATGLYEYPSDKAVLVALKTVRVWLEEQKHKNQLDQIDRIIFCLFKTDDVSLYRIWMQVFYPCPWKLLPLLGFIETTTTEPDMLDMDDSPVRAKMPCGHVIGPISMTNYCQNVLSKGQFKFYCPSVDCNREWDYILVRHVARLSPEEMKEVEKKISNNYLNKAKGIQTCPGCNTWCYKGDGTGNYVRCSQCEKHFCWACMRDWIGPRHGQSCGNSDCNGMDSRTRILANCTTKEIKGCQACPKMRACPKCGMLTEHKEKCAHVTCPSCRHGFCFICLKGKNNEGVWRCSYEGTCTLAPIQTSQSENTGGCSIM